MFRERELLFKAYCVYVRPLLEYCLAVWSPHSKFLVVKNETGSVQWFFTKRLQGMRNKRYNDPLRLLNATHSLEYRRLYNDEVLCFQLLKVMVLIHSLSTLFLNLPITELGDTISNLLNKLALWMLLNITLQIE